MQKIHQLSDEVITKIAAGEVIERPAFVVKELIENSLDANASSIYIDIENGGLKRISVMDDGEGMSKEDLQNSIKHHTTSKIYHLSDLHKIQSFGFRGEALSSIASVSELLIKSRTKNTKIGSQIKISTGDLISAENIGMAEGTIVTVNKLFDLVPVRKKFLKNERSEYHQILEIILPFLLANPKVRFSLIHNQKIIFDSPANTIEARLKLIFGDTIYQELISMNYENSYLKISSFIARPIFTSSSMQKQFIFINRRKVTDPLISSAVKEAFGSLISSDSYPIFALFLELPFEFVDVNIHPQKTQVNFSGREFVFSSVKEAIVTALIDHNLTLPDSSSSLLSSEYKTDKLTKSFAGKLLKQAVLSPPSSQLLEKVLSDQAPTQFHNLYIVYQTDEGIIFVDQHAAHERILYEKFRQNFLDQRQVLDTFPLTQPKLLDLSLPERELIQDHLAIFKKLGFTIERFNNSIMTLSAIPQIFKDRDPLELLNEILEDLKTNGSIKAVDRQSDQMLKFLACRAAVKAGDPLTQEACRDLLNQLNKTPNSATCPHGRPTQIIVSLRELHKKFKRT